MKQDDKNVLAVLAHPDDAEIVCAGTLSLLRNAGWNIHMATMTPGDKGTAELTREEISEIRKKEAAKSASILKAKYYCLEFEDIYFTYNRDTINQVTSLIRKVRPDIVFTASPADYMFDHEVTSQIVQTACFGAGIKNMEVTGRPYEKVPILYYCDPLEAKDKLGNPVIPAFYVDISIEMGTKEKMLSCHASQRNWLLKHHKMDEYILTMKEFGEKRGHEINVRYAEAFRQHLGHGFPRDNILAEIIPEHIKTI